MFPVSGLGTSIFLERARTTTCFRILTGSVFLPSKVNLVEDDFADFFNGFVFLLVTVFLADLKSRVKFTNMFTGTFDTHKFSVSQLLFHQHLSTTLRPTLLHSTRSQPKVLNQGLNQRLTGVHGTPRRSVERFFGVSVYVTQVKTA